MANRFAVFVCSFGTFGLIWPFFTPAATPAVDVVFERCWLFLRQKSRERAREKMGYFWEYERFMFHITIFQTCESIDDNNNNNNANSEHTHSKYLDRNGMMGSFKSNVSHIRMHIGINILPFFAGHFIRFLFSVDLLENFCVSSLRITKCWLVFLRSFFFHSSFRSISEFEWWIANFWHLSNLEEFSEMIYLFCFFSVLILDDDEKGKRQFKLIFEFNFL